MARAPKDRLRERGAYEFFAGVTASGKPRGSRDIGARKPVFRFPGQCQRADVVYNSLVKRYMLALGYDQKGGWDYTMPPLPGVRGFM